MVRKNRREPKFLTSIGNRGCTSSDGTRNNFSSFMFNSMKMWGSGGQKIFAKTIRDWGWDNCGGCRVFDSKDSWVSLTLLTAPQAIAIASIAYPRYIKVSPILT